MSPQLAFPGGKPLGVGIGIGVLGRGVLVGKGVGAKVSVDDTVGAGVDVAVGVGDGVAVGVAVEVGGGSSVGSSVGASVGIPVGASVDNSTDSSVGFSVDHQPNPHPPRPTSSVSNAAPPTIQAQASIGPRCGRRNRLRVWAIHSLRADLGCNSGSTMGSAFSTSTKEGGTGLRAITIRPSTFCAHFCGVCLERPLVMTRS